MGKLRFLITLGASLALAACATNTPTPEVSQTDAAGVSAAEASAESKLTILVSIDGFRADYLDRGYTPVLKELAETGAHAAMRPSFPSKTFPNHYTLITGLRPDKNGMINNTMEDPSMPGVTFTLPNRAVASNPAWWDQGTPLWVSAEKQGIKTATMFWPGSDYEIHGVRPSDHAMFDQKLPDFARVDMLLAWLDKPEDELPGFATLYFDIVDTAGHIYGPDNPKTNSAMAQVDASLERLLEGLEARGLREHTNLVIVADHGMAPIADDQIMDLTDRISINKLHVVWTGAFAGLSPKEGFEADVEEALVGRSEHGECWKKEDLPERFAYGENPRVPAIVCLADTGWRYETPLMRAWRNSGGDHGFDPADPLMAALFIANGPAIKSGVELDSFDNVSVYPLLAKLAGVEPVEHDGDLGDVAPALK